MLFEALEDGGGVLRGDALEQLGGLFRLELADDVRDVLGVQLVEQRAHLVRILLQDLLDVGAEEGRKAQGSGSLFSQLGSGKLFRPTERPDENRTKHSRLS